MGAGPAPRAPSHMTASSGPRTPGPRSPDLPAPGARESEAARWDPSYFVPPGRAGKFVTFLLRGAGTGRRGARPAWAAGRDGREAASRAESRLLRRPRPPPRSLSVPTEYPPGGEILLHAQQPLPQGLQHLLRHRGSSPRVSDRRRSPRPAHLSPARPHARRPPRPAPGRPRPPAAAPSAFRPARRAGPTPRRPRSRSGPRRAGCGKGAALS